MSMQDDARVAAEALAADAARQRERAAAEVQRAAEWARTLEAADADGRAQVAEFLALAAELEQPSSVGHMERERRDSGPFTFRATWRGYGLTDYVVLTDGRVALRLWRGSEYLVIADNTVRTSRWRATRPGEPHWVTWSPFPTNEAPKGWGSSGTDTVDNPHFVGRFREQAVLWLAARQQPRR